LRIGSVGSVGWKRAWVVAAVAAVGWLGNLRSATSDDVVPKNSETVVADAVPIDPSVDADGVASAEARLVPAIYAWDPDVRVIYLRRLSKWM
jgi:hypothetical protein